MPRIARTIPDEGVLHVIANRNNNRKLFRKEKDYNFLLRLIYEYKTRYLCSVYHYALMSTHVHLIIEIAEKARISKMMHGVCMRYASYYNKKYGLKGHFWQDRFKSPIIADDEYLLRCGLYIEKNPVEAGIINKPEDYKWSSYNFYAFGEKNDILTVSPFYKGLGESPEERQIAYRALMRMRLAEAREAKLAEKERLPEITETNVS